MARRLEQPIELDDELGYFETPELRARRARLRRVVAGALGVSVALLLVGAVARHSAQKAQHLLEASSLGRTATLNALLPREPSPAPAPPIAALPGNPATVDSAESSDVPSALTRAARALLESGHTREGVAAARDAVDADPSDAEPYLLLATGLEDLGNWSQAHTIFLECGNKTKRGPNASCRYFAGR